MWNVITNHELFKDEFDGENEVFENMCDLDNHFEEMVLYYVWKLSISTALAAYFSWDSRLRNNLLKNLRKLESIRSIASPDLLPMD